MISSKQRLKSRRDGAKRLKATIIGGILVALVTQVLPLLTPPAHATIQTPLYTNVNPDLYVVMFRADWCGPCKIVEPNLGHALSSLQDPSIELVEVDITTPILSERSAHRVFDRNLVRQYNEWMGVTGFAAIIDADTKNTLGCVNMTYDAQTMARHIKNLKTYALANKPSFDLTCPAPNPPR